MSFIYKKSGDEYAVGHYNPAGEFVYAQMCETKNMAQAFCAWLNGSGGERPPTDAAERLYQSIRAEQRKRVVI